MYKIRSRFGTNLIESDNILRTMYEARNKTTLTAFIADQTPPPENAYWMKFLNQDTPVFVGTEKISMKFNYPVIFASVKRVKRGFYDIYFELLTEKPAECAPGDITEMHTKRL